MSDAEKPKTPEGGAQSSEHPSQRRDVLKGAALGAGIVVSSKWAKPVVEASALPAHAAATPGGLVGRNQGAGGSAVSEQSVP